MSNKKTSRRYADVATDLRHYINQEGYAIGDKLPTERSLAEHFEVSRALLREALIMLEIQGEVEVRQGSGIYLLKDHAPSPFQPVENDIGPFELLQARQVLESSIAEAAAHAVTKRDIEALQSLLFKQEQEIKNNVTDYRSDELFHLRIAEATQNSALNESVTHLWMMRKRSSMWEQLHTRITNTEYWKAWIVDHQNIFNALRCKDANAARQAMWQHLENVRETVLLLSDVDTPEFDGYLFKSLPL